MLLAGELAHRACRRIPGLQAPGALHLHAGDTAGLAFGISKKVDVSVVDAAVMRPDRGLTCYADVKRKYVIEGIGQRLQGDHARRFRQHGPLHPAPLDLGGQRVDRQHGPARIHKLVQQPDGAFRQRDARRHDDDAVRHLADAERGTAVAAIHLRFTRRASGAMSISSPRWKSRCASSSASSTSSSISSSRATGYVASGR